MPSPELETLPPEALKQSHISTTHSNLFLFLDLILIASCEGGAIEGDVQCLGTTQRIIHRDSFIDRHTESPVIGPGTGLRQKLTLPNKKSEV